MKLCRLRLSNFRCYHEGVDISFDDMTAIIGRNDAGKSAIMDALAIFFGEDTLDKNDACVHGDKKAVTIECEFSDVPSHLVIDEQFETTLKNEFLSISGGNLVIRKIYDGSLTTPKLLSTEAIASHPTAEGFSDLLQLKKAELIARAKSLDVDLSSTNKQANAPIRAALWAACPDLQLNETAVSLDKEGGKQVWAALSSYMPAFALFKSDRASTDQDAEAQDPLKAAIRDAIKAVEVDLVRIQQHVENEVKKIAQATVDKIREMDPNVATTLDPIISTKRWDSLFQTSITGDHGIPLNKRGSGIKRLVLLNFFRAKAEKAAFEKSAGSIIYAVEEPETSQHPHNQRMLMSALTSLAATPGRQVIVTTHTPMLARSIDEGAIRFLERANDDTRSISVGGGDVNNRIAASLGVLPDHNVKLFIGVEGKHDISFMKGISKVLRQAGEDVPDLEDLEVRGEIIFFPFGGSNLALWSSRLQPLQRPEYHICDRDNPHPAQPKYIEHMKEVNARNGCTAVTTGRREMENYIHHDAIREAYAANGAALNIPNGFADFDDVPQIVAEAAAAAGGGKAWAELDDATKSKKLRNAKGNLNTAAINKMTPDRLTECDSNGEIRGWLSDIKALVEV